ncbi:MAG TPA: hypothetical protein VE442_21745 [Jatrophihabitans sp.]|jgi:hypothetical protein|nr:hypothetical protein [Jatrophihabitans sp.]
MNRLLLIGGAAAAAALIATPTVVGLSGNTSFSRDLRVPVPSGAHHVQPSDLTSSPREDRRGDGRHGGGAEDHSGSGVAPSSTADDHGGLRTGGNSGPGGGPSGRGDHKGGDDHSGRSGGGDG